MSVFLDKCSMYLSTDSWGEEDIDAQSIMNWELPRLYQEAILRGLDPRMGVNRMCEAVRELLPDIEWEKQQIIWYSKLPTNAQEMIRSYVSYGFKHMNDTLRGKYMKNARNIPKMNKFIVDSPPLTKDIIVYRYFSDDSKMIPSSGIFQVQGYLSVSYSAQRTAHVICKALNSKTKTSVALMRILVPKGTNCIYVPGTEHELIFPHDSTLKVISKNKQDLVCGLDENYNIINTANVMVYNLEMLE